MMDPVKVANSVRESVASWLEEMGDGLAPGRFRFCKTRSLVPTRRKRGQATTCFAAKSAWHIGAWEGWPLERREECTRFIKSFQQPDGNFVDRWLLNSIGWSSRIVLAKHGRFREMFADFQAEKVRAVRAETRQSAATLMLLGDRPKYPLPIIWDSEASVREFVRSMDWTQPWGAGSHTSHLVAFLVMNSETKEIDALASSLLEAAFEESDKYLDDATGAWAKGDVSHLQRINGAMKMLTAYNWAARPVPYPDRLLDYTLNEVSGEDGCGILDRLFVIQQAGKWAPGYRARDVEGIALEALGEISRYRQDDGGFSFRPNRAQHSYYGALVSLREKQSDMHGAVMFTWACAVALDLLGIREKVGWQLSKP